MTSEQDLLLGKRYQSALVDASEAQAQQIGYKDYTPSDTVQAHDVVTTGSGGFAFTVKAARAHTKITVYGLLYCAASPATNTLSISLDDNTPSDPAISAVNAVSSGSASAGAQPYCIVAVVDNVAVGPHVLYVTEADASGGSTVENILIEQSD